VSHEGHGRRARSGGPPGTPGVITFGTFAPGDFLADRYRLDDHVDDDAAGRQIWRGTDTTLRRPVALVLRQPGGESANGMLTTAVAASRLVHPHIVSVYDAVDEGQFAYLVREWVPGVSLRDVLRQAPLDADRTTLVVHAIAEAVAALHAAGIVHGNIHPGTILIADDGRVVLADAHADGPADEESDVRAIGAVLYACLTAHWPYAEAGHSSLPDAKRDNTGRLASPRQVRGGIPRYLDDVATELLDPRAAPPPPAYVAGEFARLATQGAEQDYDDAGPMGFGADTGGSRRRGGKLAVGIALLAAIAVIGAVIGVRALTAGSDNSPDLSANSASSNPTVSPGPVGTPIAIAPNQVRIVDPPQGDGGEVANAGLAVDGKDSTGWPTSDYTRPNFGGLKPGMGILIDFGVQTKVSEVRVLVNKTGSSVELRAGTSDPGVGVTDNAAARQADEQIVKDYTPVGQPLEDFNGTRMIFDLDNVTTRYLMVWITNLPPHGNRYQLTVNEITVIGTTASS
jgi:serine/threonine protein kinase